MSTAVTNPSPVVADASAALARVSQLQQLIAQAAQRFAPPSAAAAPTASASASAGQSFASVLSSATSDAAGANASSGTASTSTPSGYGAYAAQITQAAARYGIDPSLLYGVISQESAFNPNAVSSAGAEGIAQIMPENFASLGVTNPFDPTQSIDAGAKLLSENLATFGGNTVDAVAAYNAGSAAVEQYGGVPPYSETQNYVQKVLAYAAAYPGATTAAPTATALPNTTTAVQGANGIGASAATTAGGLA
jgi:soluble lytic murein transglycosylase-like protein